MHPLPGQALRNILSILKRFILNNTLVRCSLRGLLFIWARLNSRATRPGSTPDRALEAKQAPLESTKDARVEGDSSDMLDETPRLPITHPIEIVRFSPSSCSTYPSSPSASPSASSMPQFRNQMELLGMTGYTVQPSRSRISLPYPSAVRNSRSHISLPYVSTSHSSSRLSLPHSSAAHSRSRLSLPHRGAAYSRSNISLPIPIITTTEVDIAERASSDSPIPDIHALDPDGDVLSLNTVPKFSHPRIRPFAPERILRYDRNIKIPREVTDYTIPPLTTSYHIRENPPGWIPCFHPEGALYFFHEGKRIFTDANLYEPDLLRQIEQDIATIEEFFRAHNLRRSLHVDLALELIRDGGDINTYYYFADHSKRCIYFVDEFDAAELPIWGEVRGVTSSTHIMHEIETQYWYHCLMYPKSLEITHNLVNELRDIIIHLMGDTILSQTSTSPYSTDELQKMLGLVNSLKKNVDAGLQGSTCVLSGLMYVFVRQRFYNFHGQPGARLGRDQSVHGKIRNERSLLILALSPLFFFAPEVHLRSLEKMWVDEVIRNVSWTQFVNQLNAEWQEFTLYGTVLLNANVAFLAIQSVDVGHESYRSPAQIASYASIVSSIGSIIIGLLLLRQHRSKARETAAEAVAFLQRRTSQVLGLETLAITFGLPYALLMWGMVFFLAAFLFMCFEQAGIYSRLLVGSTWLALSVLVVWCIWMAWEQQENNNEAESAEGAEAEQEEIKGQSKSKAAAPLIKSWRWPALLFRRSSVDSEKTVV
ncbi:hypothetical protein Hypma_014083 [Hypsizygus marmoreus]|uniref:Uncharacterized protein n=1 Tax=Hypsizygus marmoreus TaxID=39966 RepID=A0A369KAN8_HYPMA|nr:hypothetical protein Hypma_014083 [Hypsizygus marmoreus]